jgi:RNA polymerase sigma-70 factor (ECF subfamily)
MMNQFEALVSEHYEPLFRFAMSLTRVESDAQDLTQQTFYIWATRGHQLRDISKVKTWLYTTLHRTFLQTRRRQIRFPHHELEEVSEQLPVSPPDLQHGLDSSQALSALGRVDEIYQAAVALFYLKECSYKEIASILEIPIGTVKSRIARGIVQLRHILLPDSSGDSSTAKTPAPRSPSAFRDDTVPVRERPAPRLENRYGEHGSHYDEWDFSSTLLEELSASA